MTDALQGAADIARRLCSQAVWHGDRCNWMGAVTEESADGRVATAWAALGTDVYGGTSGVAWFLAEFSAATGDPDARRTALAALRQAASRVDDTPTGERLGLYAGWTGIALTLARCGALLDEAEPAATARTLAGRLNEHIGLVADDDLISGRAGAIIGLIQLASALDDPSHIDAAVRLGDELVGSAIDVEGTLSWQPTAARTWGNLTGLSHGTAGVGLALLELAEAVDADGYGAAADRAFAYERALFDATSRNWPDLRRSALDGAAPPAPSFMVAWCHGAPGIAVSRLRAWELTGDEVCREEAIVALETTREMLRDRLRTGSVNYSLCHGLCGNAEVLTYGATVLGTSQGDARPLAVQVAEAGTERYAVRGRPWPCGTPDGETPGLLLGLAGIGLFYLRLAYPTIPSATAPKPARGMLAA